LTQIKAAAWLTRQAGPRTFVTEESSSMIGMTMPTTAARTPAKKTGEIRELLPLLVALLLLVATTALSLALVGPTN
jgi:hypothetical protein